MFESQLTALYAIAVVYETGALLTLGWYFYKGISYRLALAYIGLKSKMHWLDWVTIGLDTIYIIIAWPFYLRRLVRDEQERRR